MQLLNALLLALLAHLLLLGATASGSSHRRDSMDIKDRIIKLQCLARCENSPQPLCMDECKMKLISEPRRGKCPYHSLSSALSLSQSPHHGFGTLLSLNLRHQTQLLCLGSCNYDHDCAEVQKCCNITCGEHHKSGCVEPLGVRNDSILPPIPKILDYRITRSHKVELKIESSLHSYYYFHVEVRWQIGRVFTPRKLSIWQWQDVRKIAESTKENSKITEVFFNIRPGRLYQVRVAAVNSFGFRGYSQLTKQFGLTSNPKPPKQPYDLKIVSRNFDENHDYMNVKVVWCPSKSNLPVEKYKIIWSLYVSSKQASLISHEAYVKDAHQYEIRKLRPQSSYYIQVQAMSISGSRRLKSEKKSLLYNTTHQSLLEPIVPLNCNAHTSEARVNHADTRTVTAMLSTSTAPTATSYEVRFRLNRKFGMIVQISGFQPHKEKVYELCPNETNCEQREFSAIRVKKDSQEFSKLKYNTTYILKALHSNSVLNDSRNSFTFTTPKCENFQKRFPKTQINCVE